MYLQARLLFLLPVFPILAYTESLSDEVYFSPMLEDDNKIFIYLDISVNSQKQDRMNSTILLLWNLIISIEFVSASKIIFGFLTKGFIPNL